MIAVPQVIARMLNRQSPCSTNIMPIRRQDAIALSRVKDWISQPLLIKPYVRFSRIRLSDVLHLGHYGFP
ncbi:hypothetical protein QFZ80_001304 [Paenibacillus sp. V4I7]|nr:hypothetical protein [Paenibacillus sp. V4I7]